MTTLADALLAPRSIALVGASGDARKNTARPLRFMRKHGFQGRVYLVNARGGSAGGETVYQSVLDIPETVDHAFVMTAARHVPQVLAECARKGVPVASIYSDGFAEIGQAGAQAQRALIEQARRDGLRVLGPNTVAYLDRTGSGNETSAHIHAGGRVTIMFCAFEGPPNILRLYGRGRAAHRGTDEYRWLLAEHFDGNEPLGTRQFIVLDVDLVQTSCGYGVPFMEYRGERPSMDNWSEKKGAEGLAAYQREKNVTSMDGLPTGLFEDGPTSAG